MAASSNLPDRIGRFEIVGVVGTGGFATVLRAWDTELEASVAIKVLLADLAVDEELRERFLREARLLRRIRHENVVTVHDVGALDDGRPWFVLDYADRGTLADRLASRPASGADSSESVVALVDALTGGLGALHEVGIVHRDVKPGNLLIRGRASGAGAGATQLDQGLLLVDEMVMVGDLGLAKDVRIGARPSVLGGTPGYQAPEQNVEGSTIGPPADVYAATAVLWRVVTGTEPPGLTEHNRLASFAAGAVRFFERGLDPDPGVRYASMAQWRAAVLDELLEGVPISGDALAGIATPSTGAVPSTSVNAAIPAVSASVARCPYKGLAAFQPDDAEFYFGREALVADLVRRLAGGRVLLVGGPSGSGKSSLVRAGLLPSMIGPVRDDGERWPRSLMTPGTDPMAELHYQLTGLAPAASTGAPSVGVDDLRAQPRVARRVVDAATADGGQVLLVVDQLEELFTLGADAAEQEAFVAVLEALTGAADSRCRVVLALRADFYGACARFPWLARVISENQVLVGPMDRSEMRRAIEEPARRAGLRLEAGLVDRVLEDAGREAGTLPLVAHALVETWVRRAGDRLTISGYEAAGGVVGAIAHSADALYEERFDAEARLAARRLFLRLVTPGEGTPDTRRRLPLAELDRDPSPSTLRFVVERCAEARLLTLGGDSVEVAHEALIQTWPRLRGWVDEERESLRVRQRIDRSAREWETQARDPDLLLRGTPLAAASEWAAVHSDQLDQLGRTYLDSSNAARLDEAALAAAAERRSRRTRRVASIALAALAAAAVVSSVVASIALERARSNEDVAEERFARALATQAVGLAVEDPYTAMALAVESAARTDEPLLEARAALVESRNALAEAEVVPLGAPLRVGDALAIALSADGHTLAVGGRDGSVQLWDVERRDALAPPTAGHDGGVEAMVFLPDARTLVSVGDDGRVLSWPVGTEDSPGTARGLGAPVELGRHRDVAWSVALSPDGSTLATASEDGTVAVWDASSGSERVVPIATGTDFLSVAFSPDGSTVAAGDGTGTITAFAVDDGTERFSVSEGHGDSDVWELVYTRDGELLSVGADGRVVVRDPVTGVERFEAYASLDEVQGLVSDDRRRLLLGGDDQGRVVLWDLDEREVVATSVVTHDDDVIASALDADARLLATMSRDQTVRLWDVAPRTPLGQELGPNPGGIRTVAVSPDGSIAATGGGDGAVRRWDVETGAMIGEARPGHDGPVWGIAWSPDGTRIATGGEDGGVRLWEPTSGESVVATGHDGPVWAVAFSPDGDVLVPAGADGTVRRWDARTGVPVGTPLGPHRSGALGLAFRPDSAELAVGGATGTVRFWDVETGEPAREDLSVGTDTLHGLTWSPDGRFLAVASAAEAVDVWSIATGEIVGAPRTPHPRGATDVVFSADGMTLAATARDGTVRLWDRDTGAQIGPELVAHRDEAWAVVRVPDTDVIVTAGLDGVARVWDLLDLARACDLAAPAFDAATRARYLGADISPRGCVDGDG